jgi:ribosomal protein S18 acetylase RimI-like enzyme
VGEAAVTADTGRLEIAEAHSADDLDAARALIREYQASLGIDLEFQHFSDEVARLGEIYGPPGGVLLLARIGGVAVGCVGVRPLEPPSCEMKRLYVAPAGRGRGLGRELTVRAMAAARLRGYTVMRLDTLPSMRIAQELYATLGFRDVPPYRDNPVTGTRFLEAAL